MLKGNTPRHCRRRGWAVRPTLAVALVWVLAACGSVGGSGAAGTGNEVTFVTAKGALEWWPVEFGREQGIFKSQGLDVKTVQAKSGPEITSIVTSGSADVGMGVLDAAVPPIKQGAEMRIIDIPGIRPSTSVIVSPAVKLSNAGAGYPKAAADLVELKIGLTALGSPSERYLRRVLKDAGVSPDKVTFVAVGPPPTAIPAFTNGRVDALAAYDPITQLLGKDAYKTVISAKDMLEHATGPASGVYFFAADDFAGSGKARTFCSAVLKTYDAIKDPTNRDAAVKSLSAWTGLPPEQSGAVLTTVKERIGDAAMDRATWDAAKQFLSTEPPAYDHAVTTVCE